MTAVCVPFRPGVDPDRDANWAFLQERWLDAGFEVFEAENQEPRFSCAGARNLAAEKAGDWDAALFVDGDILLDLEAAQAAVDQVRATGGYVAPYSALHILDRETTERVRGGYAPRGNDAAKSYVQCWPCAFAIARPLWDQLRGMDEENYPGVGYEDVDFVNRAAQLVELKRVEGDAFHLWHPPRPARLT